VTSEEKEARQRRQQSALDKHSRGHWRDRRVNDENKGGQAGENIEQ
jgi:hypothetical protein